MITKENTGKIIAYGNFGHLKHLISFEEITDEKTKKELDARKITLYSLSELIFMANIYKLISENHYMYYLILVVQLVIQKVL